MEIEPVQLNKSLNILFNLLKENILTNRILVKGIILFEAGRFRKRTNGNVEISRRFMANALYNSFD